jgi:hypothetical protein
LGKRPVGGLVVTALFALAPLTASAERSVGADAGAAARSEQVACFHYPNTQVSFKTKPRRCLFMKRGERRGKHAVGVKSMRWKRWGRPTARARGKAIGVNGFTTPAKVALSKLRNDCGRRVYSKVRIRFPEFKMSRSYRLDTCRR